jgi:hypothetical protein
MKDGNMEVRIVNEATNRDLAGRDKSGKITIYEDKPELP